MSDLKQQHEQEGAIVPASKRALANGGSPVSAYLAAHGVGMSGTFFKFAKDGKFRKTSDDEEIPEGTQFVVIYDQIQGGWIKFMGKGNQPERRQGNLFDGFVPPDRESLGDTDESEREVGLSGKPADPWQFQLLLPLQYVETGEFYVFNTTSITGRRAVDNLTTSARFPTTTRNRASHRSIYFQTTTKSSTPLSSARTVPAAACSAQLASMILAQQRAMPPPPRPCRSWSAIVTSRTWSRGATAP